MKISQSTDPLLGQAIGNHQRYVLTQRIGSGGMGEVFLATDTLLGRSVALKLLSSKLATEPMRKRFEREVAVCAALKSDHIVQVFDYGVTTEGYPFFVMEYLVGQTLGQLLKHKKRLSIEQTVNLITQVCSGLHLAHQGVHLQWNGAISGQSVKVVHRDLKPDNIFLVSTALGDFVKILDFGIAKIRSDQIEHTHITDMFMGTYQYASPEQLRAEKDLDERADIYSLGMILYKMLTGTAPFDFAFEQHPDLQPSGAVWAVAHLTKPPIPSRQQPGCEHLPLDLETILMRCLKKSPQQRFASVMELSRALQGVAKLRDVRHFVQRTYAESAEDGAPEPVTFIVEDDAPEPLTFADEALDPVLQKAEAQKAEAPNLAAPNANKQNKTEQSKIEQNKTEATEEYYTLETLTYDADATTRPSAPPRPIKPLLIGIGLALAAALAAGISFLRPAMLLRIEAPDSFKAPDTLDSSPIPSQSPRPVRPQRSASALRMLLGHTDAVWAIAIAPDGKTMASGSFDKTIRLWNLPSATWRQTLAEHTDGIRSLAISADGKTLVSGSSDKTIKIWNLRTGALIRSITGHAGPVWTVALSPDGTTLASGSYDGTIKTWDLQSGKLLQTIPEDYDSIWSVAFSPDGEMLASGSYGSTIKMWDLQTGELLRTLSGHTDAVRSIAVSSDGQTLVSGSWDKTIKVWNLQTGELLRTLSGHTDRVLSVAISPDGQTIASGSVDHTVKLWNLQTGTLLHTFSEHSDWVIAAAFSPDGKTIASASKDKTIRLWQQ